RVRGRAGTGDERATLGSRVTFGGAKWPKPTPPSGGPAPPTFKGRPSAAPSTLSLPQCGGSWTTTACGRRLACRAGGSLVPPATLPPFIAVIASSSITKSGPNISGNNVPAVTIIKTDPGYSPDPNTPGTGTVVYQT